MCMIAIVNRYTPSSSCWPNLVRKKKLDALSIEEVLIKYQGFEGEIDSIYVINPSQDGLVDIIDKTKFLENCFILRDVLTDSEMSELLKEQSFQVGYDYGTFGEEKSVYSSIFNEILFGNVVELVSFKDTLNQHLLFPDRTSAEKYAQRHHELLKAAKDVEDDRGMSIYEIWKYRSQEK